MLNRTQRNFRKEVDKITKEQEKTNKETIYSYVQGDFIEYYTSPQRRVEKKRVKNRGKFVRIFMIGFILYCAYTWIDRELWSALADNVAKLVVESPALSQAQRAIPAVVIHPKQQEVIDYLQFIRQKDQEIQAHFDYALSSYSDAWVDSKQQAEYLQKTRENQAVINQILTHVMQTPFPQEMQSFYEVVVQKYKSMSESHVYAITAVQNKDKQSDSQFRVIYNQVQILGQEQMVELTKVFDNVGIQWEKTEAGITYHYLK
ncbi:hypothetical protein EIZ39_25785 [Ammoniphilus sp. CFH 90114]|nr:hypothetical protein EIZ39_25785 [Ammoniphilus sp. CFH 90114]